MTAEKGRVSLANGCFMTNEELVKEIHPKAFLEDNIDTGIFSVRIPEYDTVECDECGHTHIHQKLANKCQAIGTGNSYEAAWTDAANKLVMLPKVS